jgi:hypothetical protein
MIQEDQKRLFKYALGATLMILIIQTMMAVRFGIFDGFLIGTDTYSWLTRVLHLHETGNWFDATTTLRCASLHWGLDRCASVRV